MLVDRNRNRSKSHKRKKTLSSEKHPDENLIKILDERAGVTKKVLIPISEFADLRSQKKVLQEIKSKYDQDKKSWNDQLCKLKSSKQSLQQENKDLRLKLNELQYKLASSQEPASEKEDLVKIKENLTHLEKIVNLRADNSKKLIMKIHKLLAKHAKILLEQNLFHPSKLKLTEGIKKISETTTELESLLGGQGMNECKFEDSSEFYKLALEKMKSQTLKLMEKLKELESAEGLKLVILDQEAKIELLAKEKDLLKEQVWKLRSQLNDHHYVIEEMKSVTRRSETLSAKSSPGKNKTYLEHDENDIQIEIANLDNEIQMLQNSLKRALVNT